MTPRTPKASSFQDQEPREPDEQVAGVEASSNSQAGTVEASGGGQVVLRQAWLITLTGPRADLTPLQWMTVTGCLRT